MSELVVRKTFSVCPVCKKRIEAVHVERSGTIFLEKTCPEHGFFSVPIWRGLYDIDRWRAGIPAVSLTPDDKCPDACGLCAYHQSGTCCVLIEVTGRCNLHCPYCFANGGEGEDRLFADIVRDIERLTIQGQTLLQLSGGEPTVRDDLPEIVFKARKAGCRYVQLNTNGVRLATDKTYLQALKNAGLSFVFLQFDGTDDAIYRALRGCDLFDLKKQAIQNCAEQIIGVTLVPTMVYGVNDRHAGDILRFAVQNSPAIRGVHFQPVSYFGRTPDNAANAVRYTLDQLLYDIDRQAGDILPRDSLKPSRCDHPLCGFHGDYTVMPDGTLYSLLADNEPLAKATADQNRAFVARRWDRGRVVAGDDDKTLKPVPPYRLPKMNLQDCCCGKSAYECPSEADLHGGTEDAFLDMSDMDVFLRRVRTHGFTVTAMAFQDAYNVDVERLKRCSLHVYSEGKFIPFCMHYL